MQNSQAAWTAETDEQRLSCLQRGPSWVLWNPLQHLHTREHLNLPMILPLPPFAPSVQSPPAEVEGNWLSSGGFGAQFTTKHELMTPASAAAQWDRRAEWDSWCWVPIAHCPHLGEVISASGWVLWTQVSACCHGSSVVGTRVWLAEPTRCAMKTLPWAKLNYWWRQPQVSFIVIHEKDEFSKQFHVN